MSSIEDVEIAIVIIKETDNALLLDVGLDDNVWMPKSQIKEYSQFPYATGDSLTITIPEWLALNKGVI